METVGGGGLMGPQGPMGDAGANGVQPGGAVGQPGMGLHANGALPEVTADLASRIANRPRPLVEQLTRWLHFNLPSQQWHRLPIWKARDTSLVIDQWVERMLAPIQSTVLFLRSRLERSPQPREPFEFTWALPPERMPAGQPSFEHYSDDVHDTGHLGWDGGAPPVPEPDQMPGEAEGPDVKVLTSPPGRERSSPRESLSESLLGLNTLAQDIVRRLSVPGEAEIDRLPATVDSREASSGTGYPQPDHALPSADRPVQGRSGEVEDASSRAEPEAIHDHGRIDTPRPVGLAGQASVYRNVSARVWERAQQAMGLSNLLERFIGERRSARPLPQRGAIAPPQPRAYRAEQRLLGTRPSEAPPSGPQGMMTIHPPSAMMIRANRDILADRDAQLRPAEIPGAGPRLSRVEDERSAEEASAVPDALSAAPHDAEVPVPHPRLSQAEEKKAVGEPTSVPDTPREAPHRGAETPLLHRWLGEAEGTGTGKESSDAPDVLWMEPHHGMEMPVLRRWLSEAEGTRTADEASAAAETLATEPRHGSETPMPLPQLSQPEKSKSTEEAFDVPGIPRGGAHRGAEMPVSRPWLSQAERVADETSASPDASRMSLHRRAYMPFSTEVVRKYHFPAHRMRMMAEEGPDAFAVEGTQTRWPEGDTTAGPGMPESPELGRSMPILPAAGGSIGGSLEPEVASGGMGAAEKWSAFRPARRSAVRSEGGFASTRPFLIHPDLLDFVHNEPEPSESLVTEMDDWEYPSAAFESASWLDTPPSARGFEPALQYLRPPAHHDGSRTPGAESPVAALVGAVRQGGSESAGIAKAPLDRPTVGAGGVPSVSAGAATGTQGSPSNVDLDSVAREVYQIIKRQLVWENERHAFSRR